MKNPGAKQHGQIYFHDIGDYLSREEKLEKISDLVSINGITAIDGWTTITPDAHNDWLNQRDDSFSEFIEIGNKKDKDALGIFENFSQGILTARDSWIYQYSKNNLENNIHKSIDFYNLERNRIQTLLQSQTDKDIGDLINNDPRLISWSRALKNDVKKNKELKFDSASVYQATYRPFTKSWMYFNRKLNEMVYQMSQIFPTADAKNLVICVIGRGATKPFCGFIANTIPDFEMLSKGQCFPLYLYGEEIEENSDTDLFIQSETNTANGKYTRKDAISDAGLKHFQDAYPTETISKEDIFYYVYGLLHSDDYRSRYADNLTKELPRIPCVNKAEDFWAFSKAGRDLAHWHLNYETVEPYKAKLDLGNKSLKHLEDKDFYVTKMKFPKKDQKDTVVYNNAITIRGIPVEAYDYVVNGKSALEWVMERQGVSTHKDSGIVNDANDWAIETMGDARYPLDLFLRVITVSLETMKIVRSLPKLDI